MDEAQYQMAVELLDEALALDPDNVHVRQNLTEAQKYVRLGQIQAAQ